MPSINPEIINRFADAQSAICAEVSKAVSESLGREFSVSDPLAIGARPEDAVVDLQGPMVVIQFAFEPHPNETQAVLIPQEFARHIINVTTGAALEEVSPETIENVKPSFLAFHQGLIRGVQSVKSESVSSTEASCTVQIFSLPPNMANADEVVRVQASIADGDHTGVITWLLDEATMRTILNLPLGSNEDEADIEVDSAHGKPSSREERDIEILLDIPLELSVELGRVSLLVQDVVDLSAGSIVELERAAGEPVDVLVNGRLVARGEVVVIEDNFGVRITEILSPQERVHHLSEAA